MIRKLLVANRGEIARRVFRTCRDMGIATVAVFSDPDRHAPFVSEADEAYALGGATPAESYLRIEAIIEAARRCGADAVHPGYGFLAENARFAQAVEDAGLVWVGPPAGTIEAMGSKLEAKRIVSEAGVPTLASVDLTDLDEGAVADAALQIGYPVLVKASAGGGGKGMRIVTEPGGLPEAVAAARREAAGAFGDDTLLLERYLTAPHHVEIQVFGDTHGNVVSLHERECSIQRRHQKIVEEAPSPAVDEALRAAMGKAAVSVAEAVGYVGAGTVEFLVSEGEFSFLEMNTRLQVEHPVTELVTGFDLVRLQLEVAAGRPLPDEALHARLSGHAIEVRLYAEDPRHGFLPVTGRIDRFRLDPARGGRVRLDSGVEDGSMIDVHYDPLLAKVIAWSETRRDAALLLAEALEHAQIHAPVTNRDLLVRILRHPEFLSGEIDTGFLERHDPADLGRPLPSPEDERHAALAAALADQIERRGRARVLATIPSGWRNNPSALQATRFQGDHGEVLVGYRFGPRGGLEVSVDGSDPAPAHLVEAGEEVGVEVDGRLRWYRVHRVGAVHHVDGPTGYSRLVELPRFPDPEVEEEPGSLHAPMPGTVIRVDVAEGQPVEEGELLVVMEAMKMEHAIRAPHPGTVRSVQIGPGDQVEAGRILVVVEERSEGEGR